MNGQSRPQPRRRNALRWVRHHLGWTLALIVLLLALSAALVRVLLPGLDHYREDVQAWVSGIVGRPVTIAGIGAEWYGWTPVLRVDALHLIGPDDEPFLRFDAILIRLDPLESLRRRTAVPDHLIIRGAHLTAEVGQDGRLRLCCLPPADDDDGDAGLAWVLEERRVEIIDSTLTIRDPPRGGASYTVTDITVGLWNTPDGHRLRGSARLPAELGGGFTLAADLDTLPGAGDWGGDVHVTAQGLQVSARPLAGRLPSWLSVGGGSADGELRGRWQNGRLMEASARLDLEAVAAAAHGRAFPVSHLGADLRFSRQGEAWSATAVLGDLRSGNQAWSTDSATLQLSGDPGGARALSGAVDQLALEQVQAYLMPLGAHSGPQAQWLQGAAPRGTVRDLAFRYRPGEPLPQALDLRATFTNLAFSRQGPVPGLSGLSGRITSKAGRATLRLDPAEVVVDATHLFRAPLQARLGGTVHASPAPDGWQLSLDGVEVRNPDLRLEVAGEVTLPEGGGPPRLSLVGEFGDGRVENISAYLPVAVMADDAVRWLDRGLVGGRLVRGSLLVHGGVGDFPFDGGTGRFEVRAQFQDALIDYKQGWPRLEEVHGEIVFIGRTMTVHGQGGKMLSSEVGQTTAFVPDLDAKDVRLDIQGRVRGPGQDGMRVLLETPLRERFEEHLAGTTIGGEVDIALDLSFLLDSDRVSLDGDVTFTGNDVDLTLLNVQLEDTRGTLHITDESLSGEGIRGRLLELPIRLDVETLRPEGEVTTRLHVRGNATPEDLSRLAGTETIPRISGTVPWRATVDIPATIAGRERATTVALASELEGLAVDLPPPLGKGAAERRSLVLNTVIGDGADQRLSFRYGDHLRGRLRLTEGPRLERGVLFLGHTQGELPAEPGLVVRGRLETVRLAPWLRVLDDLEGRTKGSAAAPIRGIDLQVERLNAFGQVFDDLSVQAGPRGAEPWTLSLDSPQAKGTVSVPGDDRAPMTINLEHLNLARGGAEAPSASDPEQPDPRRIPSLDFFCAAMSLDDLDLGEVRFTARSHENGVELTALETRGERLKVDGSGDWLARGEQQVTHLKARMRSPDLGALLKVLGFSRSGVAGGETRARLEAGWVGGPEDFALDRINGELELDIDDGRLVDVDPGATGRVFGLLSVTALPRRLKLDFSDLFTRGLSFDTIQGTFTIDNGDAYTNDLTMSSPSAQVSVAGRVGLATEDYDQLVTVSPRVTATLPLAGALAGGPVGAAVGAAAAFVAEKLLRDDVGRMVKTQYSITGPWADPEVKKLERDDPDEEEAASPVEESPF